MENRKGVSKRKKYRSSKWEVNGGKEENILVFEENITNLVFSE